MNSRPHKIQDTVREYGKRLFSFIRGRVSSNEDAEDILQEVWYQLSGAPDVIDEIGAWLYRVARNKIIDRYRKKQPDALEDYLYENAGGELGFKEILLADDNGPESAYLRDLFWQELHRALDELPKEQRDVFVLNELEGMTFAAIAEQTGENIKTLISRKGYAVRHLRQRLQTLYDEFMNY
ncbi:sigma-70 family RNA polymerase sigma factor [Compostibacter hankyongensis]|uniref:RNA polymerase sigma factor n=1 Tax=Compostibacter hankyongensis TaxID=1007089 RepID=A0ABP8FBS9_9BACT